MLQQQQRGGGGGGERDVNQAALRAKQRGKRWIQVLNGGDARTFKSARHEPEAAAATAAADSFGRCLASTA